MMEKSELFKLAVEELRKVAGDQYLKEHIGNTIISSSCNPTEKEILSGTADKDFIGLPPLGKEYFFFAGFKTSEDLADCNDHDYEDCEACEDCEANDHGWVSYAQFVLDTGTGEVIHSDYRIV